jgi:hypothetical protein
MPHYAGIGSRETPYDICQLMTRTAFKLETMGWILRSGGANGADLAFEKGVKNPRNKEIYLPWPRFNNSDSAHHYISDEAYQLASRYHPAWDRCTDAAKKLHARNCYQILGRYLNHPVQIVLCWTKDGKASGGTGQALRIAQAHNIEIVNLFHNEEINRIHEFLTRNTT